MLKSFIKLLTRRVSFLPPLIFRIEKWVRDDIYSALPSESFQELIKLLSVDRLSGLSLVRKGSAHDGGYVFCDFGVRYSKLISFGVGDNVDFEFDISNLVESIDLYDPTVENLPLVIDNSQFFRVGLAHDSSSGFTSLYDATKFSLPSSNLLLKIDIEGGEWDSLNGANEELLKSFSQIFLELHGLHKIRDTELLEKYIRVLQKLRLSHYLVSLHANNWSSYSVIGGVPLPDTIEITLVRIDLCRDFTLHRNPEVKNYHSSNNPAKPDYWTIF